MRKLFFMVALVSLMMVLAISASAQGNAFVRIIVLATDAGELDLAINGVSRSFLQAKVFGDATGWISVPSGANEVEIRFGGRSMLLTDAPVALDLADGSHTNVVVTGSVTSGEVVANVLTRDDSEQPANTARVSFFHAIEGGPVVDVWGNGNVLLRRLGYPGTLELVGGGLNDGEVTLDLDAIGGTTSFVVVPNGQTGPVVAEASLELADGGSYFAAVAADGGDPAILVFAD